MRSALSWRRVLPPAARFVLLLLLVSLGVFLLIQLIPGDPTQSLLPPGASEEQRQAALQAYGLDKPLGARYWDWLTGVLHGDFGRSVVTKVPVASAIGKAAPVSIELAVVAVVVALVVAIPLGIWCAYRPDGLVDKVTTSLTSASLAIPSFVLALVLVFVLSVQLHLLPVLGWAPFSQDPVKHLRSLVLPVITLAASPAALFIRLLKGDMIATLQQDHVLSARSRGLPTWRVLVRHALRQSSFSLVTVAGVALGQLMGGTVIVETIFSLPGLGALVVDGIYSRDYLIVQGVVLLFAITYVLLNALVDLSYPLLDPRVRRVTTS